MNDVVSPSYVSLIFAKGNGGEFRLISFTISFVWRTIVLFAIIFNAQPKVNLF